MNHDHTDHRAILPASTATRTTVCRRPAPAERLGTARWAAGPSTAQSAAPVVDAPLMRPMLAVVGFLVATGKYGRRRQLITLRCAWR